MQVKTDYFVSSKISVIWMHCIKKKLNKKNKWLTRQMQSLENHHERGEKIKHTDSDRYLIENVWI